MSGSTKQGVPTLRCVDGATKLWVDRSVASYNGSSCGSGVASACTQVIAGATNGTVTVAVAVSAAGALSICVAAVAPAAVVGGAMGGGRARTPVGLLGVAFACTQVIVGAAHIAVAIAAASGAAGAHAVAVAAVASGAGVGCAMGGG